MTKLLNVEPSVIFDMKDRLNPRKPFSYANGDHIEDGSNEKRMREKDKVEEEEPYEKYSRGEYLNWD